MQPHWPSQERHKSPPKTKSGYRGVILMPHLQKKPWKAYIVYQGEVVTIGYFETKDEAAIAYNEKALKWRGEETWLNPVPTHA